MIKIPEILLLEDYLVSTYHSERVRQQEIDETYRNDTFTVPFIQKKSWVVRTGKGKRMIDAPAEHIITSNPQVFRSSGKKTKADADARVASEMNRQARNLLWQNPQPYKEFIKKDLGRGEAWIYTPHNDSYDPDDPNDMPTKFIIPDPMIVFVDPEGGERNGVPGRVVISYKRSARSVRASYPHWIWENDKKHKDNWNTLIPFKMYYDEDVRYIWADGTAVLYDQNGKLVNGEGLDKNIYGFVPLVHAYSGFGEGSIDNDPASLAYGRLRGVRDLLGELTAIKTVLNTLIHKYAHKSLDLIYDPAIGTPTGDIGKDYSREMNAFNKIGLPTGATLTVAQDQLPDEQLFRHYFDIEAEIDQEDPLGRIGTAIGTSGRQQLDAKESALRRYDSIVESAAHAFEVAFGNSLRIMENLPKMRPEILKKADIGGMYVVSLELKADDPIDNDRKASLGASLYEKGQIDLHTNLTKYQGYDDAEADDIEDNLLAERVLSSEAVIAILGKQVIEEAGMSDQLAALEEEVRLAEAAPKTASRPSEVQTKRGREELDNLNQRGIRQRPG